MVEVLGTATRVLTLGLDHRVDGEPVLLLQAGAGTALEGWGEWAATISELAPVVAYDRPGIGESPFDGVAPTLDRVAAHTDALLDVLDAPPPYILVGHSWGGPLILYFSARRPRDVVGMVYLDPTDPRISAAESLLTTDRAEIARRTAEYDAAVAALGLKTTPGRVAERKVISEFKGAAVEDRNVPEDLPVPTAIVLGTLIPDLTGAPSYIDEDWYREMQRVRIGRFTDWTLGRPDTTLILATDAGHFVHLAAPRLATEAVRRVVGAINSER